MKTATAIRLAGGVTALAKVFSDFRDGRYALTKQSISKWGETIPPLRVYHLREIKPEWFAKGRK